MTWQPNNASRAGRRGSHWWTWPGRVPLCRLLAVRLRAPGLQATRGHLNWGPLTGRGLLEPTQSTRLLDRQPSVRQPAPVPVSPRAPPERELLHAGRHVLDRAMPALYLVESCMPSPAAPDVLIIDLPDFTDPDLPARRLLPPRSNPKTSRPPTSPRPRPWNSLVASAVDRVGQARTCRRSSLTPASSDAAVSRRNRAELMQRAPWRSLLCAAITGVIGCAQPTRPAPRWLPRATTSKPRTIAPSSLPPALLPCTRFDPNRIAHRFPSRPVLPAATSRRSPHPRAAAHARHSMSKALPTH